MHSQVFTVGHSNRPLDEFLGILKLNAVTAVADVRSQPVSRANPQFNRENLTESLRANAISYVFMGHELGARPLDGTYYVEDKVRYDRLAMSPLFSGGLERIMNGAQTHQIALMCAEKEPLQCHRFVLISRQLVRRGLSVRHIIELRKSEDHLEATRRLIDLLNLKPDMFSNDQGLIERAYELQEKKIAFVRTQTKPLIARS